MVGRGSLRALCQFLKLAAENVVHRQLLRDFPRDVDVMSPPRVQVRFLQQNDVRLFAGEELDYLVQLRTAVNVPTHNPDGFGRKKIPAWD